MKKIPLIVFSVLLLIPVGFQDALACGIHGSGNDINDLVITPLSAPNQYELRFQNFVSLTYTGSEMCGCAIEVPNNWTIISASLAEAGGTTLLENFPAFIEDTGLSMALEGDPDFPIITGNKLVALKNTIVPPGSSVQQAADLVFIIQTQDSESQIVQALQNNLLALGLVNSQGTGFDPDHRQILNIVFEIIGGTIIPIESSSLLLAGVQTPAIWMLSGLSALGIGACWITRNPYNVRNIKVLLEDYFDKIK